VQNVIRAAKSGDWSVADDGTVVCGGIRLTEGEFSLDTVAGESSRDAATAVLPRGGFIVLDTKTTPELEAEGVARDLIRSVQQARRDAGLEISDRISLTVAGPAEVLAAARTHDKLLAGETLADSVELEEAEETQVRVARV
jgi:isoleucyl-tRNA synthetase